MANRRRPQTSGPATYRTTDFGVTKGLTRRRLFNATPTRTATNAGSMRPQPVGQGSTLSTMARQVVSNVRGSAKAKLRNVTGPISAGLASASRSITAARERSFSQNVTRARVATNNGIRVVGEATGRFGSAARTAAQRAASRLNVRKAQLAARINARRTRGRRNQGRGM
jgi:hypothetical protein